MERVEKWAKLGISLRILIHILPNCVFSPFNFFINPSLHSFTKWFTQSLCELILFFYSPFFVAFVWQWCLYFVSFAWNFVLPRKCGDRGCGDRKMRDCIVINGDMRYGRDDCIILLQFWYAYKVYFLFQVLVSSRKISAVTT